MLEKILGLIEDKILRDTQDIDNLSGVCDVGHVNNGRQFVEQLELSQSFLDLSQWILDDICELSLNGPVIERS